ncbi:1-acyl-sn-glycerol-3-phosphate acyltransferase [Rhodobacteraceae bacterium NNCM2]|nr:1-acyl-sn-glycerol-3-phosphate acyltransferase [Coraliihabitans acroporae]
MHDQPNRTIALLAEALAFARTRLFELYVLIMSLGVGFLIVVYHYWVRNPRQVRGLLRFWSRSFIEGARVILGIRYRLEGVENIPNHPVIFVGNHQSYWESIAMTVFVPHLNVVTKRAAMSIPVFGWGLFHAPMIPIDRDAPGHNIRRMLREGAASIASGRSLLIFPEGGRVQVGEHRPFTRGFELLYKRCGTHVVPFVTDAGKHWPAGLKTKRPGLITMRFFPPIPPGTEPRLFADQMERFLNTEKDRLSGADIPEEPIAKAS